MNNFGLSKDDFFSPSVKFLEKSRWIKTMLEFVSVLLNSGHAKNAIRARIQVEKFEAKRLLCVARLEFCILKMTFSAKCVRVHYLLFLCSIEPNKERCKKEKKSSFTIGESNSDTMGSFYFLLYFCWEWASHTFLWLEQNFLKKRFNVNSVERFQSFVTMDVKFLDNYLIFLRLIV